MNGEPGLGYTRESQEQIQESIRLWSHYQQVAQEYNTALSKVGLDALDEMRAEILSIAEKGEKITSLRQIYDIWVNSNEKAYSRFVYTKEYSELYGRMTNALMAVKRHGGILVDEMLAAMNMPTRKGINTMQEKQRDLVRKETVMNLKIKELEKELDEVRKLISAGKPESRNVRLRKQGTTTGKTAKKKARVKKTGSSKTARKVTAKKKSGRKTNVKTKKDTVVIKL